LQHAQYAREDFPRLSKNYLAAQHFPTYEHGFLQAWRTASSLKLKWVAISVKCASEWAAMHAFNSHQGVYAAFSGAPYPPDYLFLAAYFATW